LNKNKLKIKENSRNNIKKRKKIVKFRSIKFVVQINYRNLEYFFRINNLNSFIAKESQATIITQKIRSYV
jgi:hypothetical protein